MKSYTSFVGGIGLVVIDTLQAGVSGASRQPLIDANTDTNTGTNTDTNTDTNTKVTSNKENKSDI